MNKILLYFAVLVVSLLFSACASSPKSRQVVLKVQFAKFKPGDTVLLVYATSDTLKRLGFQDGVAGDTVVLDSSGSFLYTKTLTEALHYKILYPVSGRMVLVGAGVFLDTDTTIVEVDSVVHSTNSLTVKKSGSAQKDFLAYQEQLRPLSVRADSLQKVGMEVFFRISRAGKNPPKALQQQMEDIRSKFFAMYFESQTQDSLFIAKHPKSPVSAWLVANLSKSIDVSPLGKQGVVDKVEKLLALLDKSLSNTVYVKGVEKDLQKLRSFSKGAIAPDFRLPTPAGDSVSLSSFRGKIVVLDFWASWCGPCRVANPRMVELYKKYKDKGVEFFGVSLDEDKSQWVKAIKKDKLTWTNVSDLKGWNSSAANLYEVHAIPATFLIDRDGKIIGNFMFEDLEKALEKALK